MRYDKHVFVCANQKGEGKACCGETKGLALVGLFREQLKAKGLHGKIRVQKSGCLDVCSRGPALVVYPEGTYYGNVTNEDVNRIVEEHLIANKPVSELVLNFDTDGKIV